MPNQSTQTTQPPPTPKSQPSSDKEIVQLLQKNLEYNEKIFEICKKTKRYILFSQIMTVVKILLVVVPIILAIIYLPPLLKQVIGPYQELLKGTTGQPGQTGNILEQLKNVQNLEQFKEMFK